MKEPATPAPITNEIASIGKDVNIFQGWINRMENPDPVLRSESGGKGIRLYDEVDRDSHGGSVLSTRYLALAGREYEVHPGADDARGQEIADFVQEALEGCNFTQAVQELMQAVLYGFFVAEVMWASRNGKWVPARFIGKHPRRFTFTLNRELRLLTPASLLEGEPVPDRKFVVFTFGSSDNPFGKGLGQKMWWNVWFKKHGVKFWLTFLDKFGGPTAVGKYPAGTPKAEQDKLLEVLDSIQRETGVTIPEGMTIELLEAARSGKVEYGSLCEFMDRQMSKAVLGQTATTEGTPGKLGNEDAQDQVRQDILKADGDLLAECLNATLVKWITDYNFSGVTKYPKLWFRTVPEQDLKTLADRDKTLVKEIGVPVDESYWYETYNLPKPKSGEQQGKANGEGEEKEIMREENFSGEKSSPRAPLSKDFLNRADLPGESRAQEWEKKWGEEER